MFKRKTAENIVTKKAQPKKTANTKEQKTKILIKYNAGFPNSLYIRGQGANLNWNKGIPLKNVTADEWVWETDQDCNNCEFKILINDEKFEHGDNHRVQSGETHYLTPIF